MVKANELRVGNWIADHEAGGYFQIEEIYKVVDYYWVSYRNGSIRCAIDELEEIPLTEEWLVKFGFDFLYMEYDGFSFFFDKIGSDFICHIKDAITIEIEYVHQLQNIIFSLTGQELEIIGGNNE